MVKNYSKTNVILSSTWRPATTAVIERQPFSDELAAALDVESSFMSGFNEQELKNDSKQRENSTRWTRKESTPKTAAKTRMMPLNRTAKETESACSKNSSNESPLKDMCKVEPNEIGVAYSILDSKYPLQAANCASEIVNIHDGRTVVAQVASMNYLKIQNKDTQSKNRHTTLLSVQTNKKVLVPTSTPLTSKKKQKGVKHQQHTAIEARKQYALNGICAKVWTMNVF